MSVKKEFNSVKITRIFLIIAGFWATENRKEEIILLCCRIYSFQAIVGAVITQVMEFLISMGNISDFTHWLCSSVPTIQVIIKFSVFYYKRRKIVNIIQYTKKHIWLKHYNKEDQEIIEASNKEATFIIYFFVILIYGVVICYMITPVIENIGKSKMERKFPFNGIAEFLDDESTKSPNFEIIYTIETMPLFHIGVLFSCFDNLLFLLTAFLVSQFKILQRHLKTFCDSLNVSSVKSREEINDELKALVEYHKSLTIYVSHMEDIFSVILFCNLLMSAILICVAGFQVFLVESSAMQGMLFKTYLAGGISQILIVTWTSNNIITESNAVAYAVYEMPWYSIPYDKYGKSIRLGTMTMIMRSYRSCYLSAGGFFPVSMTSFMSVLSTTVSYFTLLRQFL